MDVYYYGKNRDKEATLFTLPIYTYGGDNMVKFIEIPEKDKERLFVDLCMFMQRTEPLFFEDTDGVKYCAVHGLKKDHYTSVILGDLSFNQIYRMAEKRGFVNGTEHLNMLICHSLGLSDDIKNDDRCKVLIETGYPIAFSWNGYSLNCAGASPDYSNELVVESIDDDRELVAALEFLQKHGKIQIAGDVKQYLEYFKVYEREVLV